MGPAPHADDAGAWAGRAADVPAEWFAHFSWLHGVRHTQRVHIHAQRLVRELRWPEADAGVVLSAVLWHDIGRVNDGWDPQHGALGAARVVELGLHESLPEADTQLALFAVRYHCRGDGHGALRAITLATAAVRAGGYRVAEAPGHQRITIELLPVLLGDQQRRGATYLDACRRKRDVAECEHADTITPAESRALLATVRELQEEVLAWLAEEHPELVGAS